MISSDDIIYLLLVISVLIALSIEYLTSKFNAKLFRYIIARVAGGYACLLLFTPLIHICGYE